MTMDNPTSHVRQVWKHNLIEEMNEIMDVVEKFSVVAVDTEYPGVLLRPVVSFKSSHDYHYQTLKCNVDLLNLIQIGLTFSDENGNKPDPVCTWQFNLEFNLQEDLFSFDSIQLLEKVGVDFQEHTDSGISRNELAEVLTVSGLVLNDEVRWVAFHGGFDFAYLLRLLSGKDLPEDEGDFFGLLGYFFPKFFDVKVLNNVAGGNDSSLENLAKELAVDTRGPTQQSGIDSYVTLESFFALRKKYFTSPSQEENFVCDLYGIGAASNFVKPPRVYMN